MKDLPIGSRIILEVVEGKCEFCFFRYDDCFGTKRFCVDHERKDKKSIIYKEVKE